MQASDLTVRFHESFANGDNVRTFMDLTFNGVDQFGHDWRLYFSLGLKPVKDESRVNRVLVDGRYGFIEPGDGWQSLGPGETVTLEVETWLFSGMHLLNRQGLHLVRLHNGNEESLGTPVMQTPVLAPLDRPRLPVDRLSPNTVLEPRTELDNEAIEAQFVIPGVKEYALSPETIEFDGLSVIGPGVDNEVDLLQQYLEEISVPQGELAVELKLDANLIEDYTVDTDFSGCTVTGQDPATLLQGIQTFRQLLALSNGNWSLPKVAISDIADFEHRGLYLDLARHFHTADQIRKVLDAMARYKLNCLQLGISNDEGWRLEIASIPALTGVGSIRSWRQFNADGTRRALAPAWGDGPDDAGGYLSASDFIEILRYAGARHIEIIPEINLPGHANALLRALDDSAYQLVDPDDTSVHRSAQGYEHNVINVGMPDTYEVIRLLLQEICDMYQFAGVPLKRIHLGGDEIPPGAWLQSPACHALDAWDKTWDPANPVDADKATAAMLCYHALRVREILADIAPATETGYWHEMSPFADDLNSAGAWFNLWTTEAGDRTPLQSVCERQQAFVICNASYLYLDMPHAMAADEPGLPWAGYTDTRSIFEFDPIACWDIEDEAHLVRGLQAQLWSETVVTSTEMDYYLFPRLLAVAERAWNRIPVPGTWPVFLAALARRELPWLETRAIGYRPLRLPPDNPS